MTPRNLKRQDNACPCIQMQCLRGAACVPTPQGPETEKSGDSRSGDQCGSGDLVRRPKGPEATNESAERLPLILAELRIGQCREGGWVSNERVARHVGMQIRLAKQ